jgi:hypothetical protein
MAARRRPKRPPPPRPTPRASRNPLAKIFRFAGKWCSLLLLIAILIPVTRSPPYANRPPIRSDGVGYHIWIRAILERDLSFCKWTEISAMFSSSDPARGVCRNKYPPGLALLQFPVMAPLVDLHTETPLIGPAEHSASLILGALALALACGLMLASCYRLGTPPWAANFAVPALVFGTGLFHYGTYDSSFTHIYSALGFSLILWLWLRSGPPWAFALTCFFLVAMRSTNLIPILFLLPVWHRSRDRQGAVAALAGVALAIALLVAYNYYATRQFSLSTYGQESFHFDRPMQGPVLFSYERGLFTYYPVLAVALAAGLWARRTRLAACWFLGLLAAFVILYGFWAQWFLGGGMGHRGFVELMPFAAVLFACALPGLAPRYRAAAMALAAVSVFLTLEIMHGYWAGTFPFQGATAQVYWEHILGKSSWLP